MAYPLMTTSLQLQYKSSAVVGKFTHLPATVVSNMLNETLYNFLNPNCGWGQKKRLFSITD